MSKTLAALALGLLTLTAYADDKPLKVGTTAAFAIPLEAAVEEAGKQGLKVELVEFTDWIAPNVTLAAGDIDVKRPSTRASSNWRRFSMYRTAVTRWSPTSRPA